MGKLVNDHDFSYHHRLGARKAGHKVLPSREVAIMITNRGYP